MPHRDESIEEALRQSWQRFRDHLPLNLGDLLDPRAAFELLVMRNGRALVEALQGSSETMRLLNKMAATGALSAEEKRILKSRLAELAKSIPALGIFALPGGSLLLPILASRLPWDIVPSAYKNASDAGGRFGGGRGRKPPSKPNP